MVPRRLLGLLLSTPVLAATSVTNLAGGEELRYPVALLRGTTDAAGRAEVVNQDNDLPDGRYSAAIAAGRFALLVELRPGDNRLRVTAGDDELSLALRYRPMTNERRVRLVYLTGSEGETVYPSPDPAAPQDYVTRLQTAARLMQTFSAEAMQAHGHGRLTFALEEGDDGRPVVHTLAFEEPAEAMRQRDPGDQWQRTNRFLAQTFDWRRDKVLCMNGFVAYDREQQRTLGHTALGGGGLAVFSANALYAWPATLADVERAFSDAALVDTEHVADDTAYRGTNWAMAATGIGAWLHELGHTFGLPHSHDGRCIMARGFDHFEYYFMPVEAPTRRRTEPHAYRDDEMPYWDPYFSDRLRFQPWFQADEPPASDLAGPSASVDWASDTVEVTAPAGIAVLQYQIVDERLISPSPGAQGQTALSLPRAALHEALGNPRGGTLIVFDSAGRSLYFNERAARNPAWYLTRWRLSEAPTEWRFAPAPPELDAAALGALTETLLGRPLEQHVPAPESGQYSVDFGARFGDRGNCLAYALRTIDVEAETRLRLLVGGDDGVRAWLNGELVVDVSGVHVVDPDGGEAEVTLRPGRNVLVVESQQGPGTWLLSVRLTDPEGVPVGLTEEGRLAAE